MLAGPNGSGKTTFAEGDPTLRGMMFVNADLKARELTGRTAGSAQIAAARDTISVSRVMVQRRATFALETTLAGRYQLALMETARRFGYEIDLMFLCLDNPNLNQLRVAARVALGGHNVPPADIHRRYARSLANLPVALSFAHRARLVDNSAVPRLIARLDAGRCVWTCENVPGWAATALRGARSA
jgi:predicted ABC-type ATPase